MALRRMFRVTPAVALLVLAGCVPEPGNPALDGNAFNAPASGDGPPPVQLKEDGTSQPRTATYTCAGGGVVTIQNLGTVVRVIGPDGIVNEELPASPANQSSRFGADHDAIVIDGRDALIMKGGRTPVTCRR